MSCELILGSEGAPVYGVTKGSVPSASGRNKSEYTREAQGTLISTYGSVPKAVPPGETICQVPRWVPAPAGATNATVISTVAPGATTPGRLTLAPSMGSPLEK